MKKSIFLSVLALAAVVSCQKSEIVDSKYGNEAIGFETYAGRDAQTKATVVTGSNIKTAGLYGFYTAAKKWSDATGEIANPTPNLWANAEITNTGNWAPSQKRYWTNATDYYSFLAYSPYATTENGLSVTTGANPTVTYTVPTTLSSQVDLLYANDASHINTHKPTGDSKLVTLKFNHALSRISVWANETHPDYTYTITSLSLTGSFTEKATFNLKNGAWGTATSVESDAYPFEIQNATVDSENYVPCTGNNYLMIIPASVTDAVLSVTYKTTYNNDAALVSNPITKKVAVSQDFAQGKAYAIQLSFGPNPDDEIKFTVSVSNWENVAGTENEETGFPTNPANPEQGSL